MVLPSVYSCVYFEWRILAFKSDKKFRRIKKKELKKPCGTSKQETNLQEKTKWKNY